MACWGRCSGNHIPDGGDTGHGKTFNINGDCKQVFLDFPAQLRGYYINRDRKPAFQSVILAGVYDVRNSAGKSGQRKTTNSIVPGILQECLKAMKMTTIPA